jgi:hypothetical protein
MAETTKQKLSNIDIKLSEIELRLIQLSEKNKKWLKIRL